MKFSVQLSEFSKVLQEAIQAVPPKSTLPLLESFHFSLSDNVLVVTATDQELTIISNISVVMEMAGEVLAPARKLFDIVRMLGNAGSLVFSVDEKTHKITIKSERGEYTMFGQETEDYPKTPVFDEGKKITFASTHIQQIAQKTTFAVSKDEYRPAMQGVFFEFTEGKLNAVATDGFRLARYTIQGIENTDSFGIIIPSRTVDLLKKADVDAEILIADTHVKISLGRFVIISRLIDEKFPAYQSVIPMNNDKVLRVQVSDVIASIKRVSLFSNANSKHVKFALTANTLTVAGEDNDNGNRAIETLMAEYSNEDFEIGFNYQYVQEALSHIADSNGLEIEMSFSTSTRAALIRPVKDNEATQDILMLVMPVRL